MCRLKKVKRVKELLSDNLLGFDEPIDVLTFTEDGDDNLLHSSVIRGNIEAVQLLIDLGIDINALGDLNQSALHYAALFKHDDIYDLLISKGADVNIRSQLGKTPPEIIDINAKSF